MATVKAPNYSVEQVARLTEVYDPTASEDMRKSQVAELAAEFDKKPNSIIAKLSNMKVYISKAKVSTVTGVTAAKKREMADTIMNLVEDNYDRPEKVGPINPETLEKANKTDLNVLILFINSLLPEVEEVPDSVAETGAEEQAD